MATIVEINAMFAVPSDLELSDKRINTLTRLAKMRESMAVMGPDARENIAAAQRGKKLSPEHRAAIGGRPNSEEQRAQISATLKATLARKKAEGFVPKPQSAETIAKRAAAISAKNELKRAARAAGLLPPLPKLTCPHCGKIGNASGIKQYHFDKCKHKLAAEAASGDTSE